MRVNISFLKAFKKTEPLCNWFSRSNFRGYAPRLDQGARGGGYNMSNCFGPLLAACGGSEIDT